MNIFYLDHDVTKCAEYHNAKHVIKMILEQSQILSTAHRVLDGQCIEVINKGRKVKKYKLDSHDDVIYSATHINHPSTKWARQNLSNYKWLYEMTLALSEEYTYRYGKVHKCEWSGLLDILATPPKNIPIGEFTQPTPAMDDKYITGDSIQSYRNYYINAKSHLADWSGKVNSRNVPFWFK